MHLFLGPLILGLSLAAPVGPINIEIIKRGIQYGFWPSWFVGIGGMSADIIFMILIVFGVSKFLTSATAQLILLFAGFVMLCWIGIESIKMRPQPLRILDEKEQRKGLAASFFTGFFIAGMNPINIFFWLGIYGALLSDHLKDAAPGFILLYSCAVFIGVALWNLNIALTVHFARAWLQPRFLRIFTTVAGLTLIGYGIRLGWQGLSKIIEMI